MDTEHTAKGSLLRSAGRGAAWQVAGGGWQAAVRLGASVVLARLLTPMDFGIVSMAILGRELIRQVGNLGMGAGIIAKKDLSREDLNTCFWCMTCASLALMALAYAGAPLVGMFFRTEEMVPVLRVVSLTLILDFVRIVPVMILQRELRFRPLILIRSAAVVLELSLAILLVVSFGYAYWALVCGMLLASFFITALVFYCAGWLPGMAMNRQSLKYFMHFGLNLQGFSVVNFLHQHLDYILIGRILGTVSLGYYQFATKIPYLFKQRIASPLAAVIFPTISRFQDQDDQLLRGYSKAIQYIALGIFPAMGGLAVLARELVTVLWGQSWLPVVLPMQIFCVCGAVRCIMTPIGSVFNSKHRPDLLFKFSLFQLGVTLVAVGALGYFFGLNGVAFGMLIVQLGSLVQLKMMAVLVNASLTTVLASLKQAFWATAFMMAVLWPIKMTLTQSGLQAYLILLCTVPLGVVIYVLSLRLLYRDVFDDVLETANRVVGEQNMQKVRRLAGLASRV